MISKKKIKKDLPPVNLNKIRKDYTGLIQFAIKKGNKTKIENIFRKALFFNARNNNNLNFSDISKACKETTPKVNVKTERKAYKNIYIPIILSKSHAKYLSSNWLINNSKKKTNKTFYKNLIEELIESSKKKSISFQKCNDLHKLAVSSINNLKSELK